MAFTIIRKTINGRYGPCYTTGRARTIDHILLHHTASGGSGGHGGADAVWTYWYNAKPGSRTSANYVVGKDGSILECVQPTDTAWHAGTDEWNARSIGIEIVNLGNGRDPYPDKQVQAVAWLCRKLMKRFPVIDVAPLSVHDGHQRLGDIWEHAEVMGGKVDMSANFPWKRLYQYIKTPPLTLTGRTIDVPVPKRRPWWWKYLTRFVARTK
jgi:N-acetyl-anhydromuramyl-L-alanine amidase AmpD